MAPCCVLWARASTAEQESGAGLYEPGGFAVGVPVGQIRAALTARAVDGGRFAFPYNCLLIRAGGRTALVDTGMGPSKPGAPASRGDG